MKNDTRFPLLEIHRVHFWRNVFYLQNRWGWHMQRHITSQVFKHKNRRRQNKTTWWRSYLLSQWEGIWGVLTENGSFCWALFPHQQEEEWVLTFAISFLFHLHLRVGLYLSHIFNDRVRTQEEDSSCLSIVPDFGMTVLIPEGRQVRHQRRKRSGVK